MIDSFSLKSFILKLSINFALFTNIITIDNVSDQINQSKIIALILKSIQNEPVINGFRVESSKYPVVIDDNGVTLIPDNVLITLRLFGNNLITGHNIYHKIRIGFTTKDGLGGEECDPNTNEFTVHRIIDNNMALVDIKLSETIRDDPYYLCYGLTNTETTDRLLTDFKTVSDFSHNFQQKPTKFYYLSNQQSMKVRVIGRQLSVMYRNKNENRDANIKNKLAQIMDEVNKIHRLADEMQDWKV